jgi:hypothetical protein
MAVLFSLWPLKPRSTRPQEVLVPAVGASPWLIDGETAVNGNGSTGPMRMAVAKS